MRLTQWVAVLAVIGPSIATRDPGRSLRQRWWWLDEEKDHEPSKNLPNKDKDSVLSKDIPYKDEPNSFPTSDDNLISLPTSYVPTTSSSQGDVPDKDKTTSEPSTKPIDISLGSDKDDKSTSYADKDKSSKPSDQSLSSPAPSEEHPATRTVTDTSVTRLTLTLTQPSSTTSDTGNSPASIASVKSSSFPNKDESTQLSREDSTSLRTVTDTTLTRITLSLTASTGPQSSSSSTSSSSQSYSGTSPAEPDRNDRSSSVTEKDQSSRVPSKDRSSSGTSVDNSSTRLTLSLTRSRSSPTSNRTPASYKSSGKSLTPMQSDNDNGLPSKDRPSQSTSVSNTLISITTSTISPGILQGSSGLISRSNRNPPKVIYTITVQPVPQSTSGLEPTLSGPSSIYSVYKTDSSESIGGDSGTASRSNGNNNPTFVSNPEIPAFTRENPSGVSIIRSKPTLSSEGTATTVTFVGYEVVSISSEIPSSTAKPPFTNSSSSVIPVWTPPMLGNAYGGGFIITPSIYVTKAPFSSVSEAGVPPGYGGSVEEAPPSGGPRPSFSPNDDFDRPPLSRSDIVIIPTSAQETQDVVEGPSFLKGSPQPTLVLGGSPSKTIIPVSPSSSDTNIDDKPNVIPQSPSLLSSVVEALLLNTRPQSILSEADASPAPSPIGGFNPGVATQGGYPDDMPLKSKDSVISLPSATSTTLALKDSLEVPVIAGDILSDSASSINGFRPRETATPAVSSTGNVPSEATAPFKTSLQPLALGDSNPSDNNKGDFAELYTGFETFSEVTSGSSAYTPNAIIPGILPTGTSSPEQTSIGISPVSPTYGQLVGTVAQDEVSESSDLISAPTTPSAFALPGGFNAQQSGEAFDRGISTEPSPDTQPKAPSYVAPAKDRLLSKIEGQLPRKTPGAPSATVLVDTFFATKSLASGSSSDNNLSPTSDDSDTSRGETPAPGVSGIEATDVPQETPPGGILSYIEDEFYFPESEGPNQSPGLTTEVLPVQLPATATSVLTSGFSTSTGGNGSINNTRSFAFGAVSPLTFDGEGFKLPTIAIHSLMVVILPLVIICAFL